VPCRQTRYTGLVDRNWRRRLDPDERYGLRATLLWFAAALVAVPFAVLVLQVRADGPIARFDVDAARDVHDWARSSDAVVWLARAATTLGNSTVLWLAVAAGVAALLARDRVRAAVFLVATALGGTLLNQLVKTVVGRDRPLLPDPLAVGHGKSFPSGHAMNATVVYGALLVVVLTWIPRRWWPATIAGTGLLVLAVGGSRVVLGVHYVSDVVGGFVLGSAWLAASVAAFALWRAERLVRLRR
jgi:membrane-associated phospholipid phosphatase